MKLYYSPGACSLAPHIVAREIALEFDLVEIKVADRANFTAEYLAVNSRARVPALEVDGKIYTEVPALLVYFASLKPQEGLLPELGSTDLARCLEWLAWFSSNLHIAYAQLWRPERFLPPDAETDAFTSHGRTIVERMNSEVEERLVGPWLLGDHYSVADAYAMPFYRWGNRIGLPMSEQYPRWAEWSQRMVDRPAVRDAIEREGIGFELFDAAPST